MSIAEEINKLHELHTAGALTEEEFEAAKAAVLARYNPEHAIRTPADTPANTGNTVHLGELLPAPTTLEPDPEAVQRMQSQLNDLRRQNAVLQIDQDWERERQEYMVRSKNGSMSIPTKESALGILAVGGVGLFIFICWITSAVRGFAGQLVLPLLLMGMVIAGSVAYQLYKAVEYERAEQEYYARRAAAEQRNQ